MEFVEYERQDAVFGDSDPRFQGVFVFVRDSIARVLPDHVIVHVGSTSVPGLRGKGIVDLMVLATGAVSTRRVAEVLEGLGMQHARGSKPWRPFLLGAVADGDEVIPVHVHVVQTGSDEEAAQRGLADALRQDDALRREYESLKEGP